MRTQENGHLTVNAWRQELPQNRGGAFTSGGTYPSPLSRDPEFIRGACLSARGPLAAVNPPKTRRRAPAWVLPRNEGNPVAPHCAGVNFAVSGGVFGPAGTRSFMAAARWN